MLVSVRLGLLLLLLFRVNVMHCTTASCGRRGHMMVWDTGMRVRERGSWPSVSVRQGAASMSAYPRSVPPSIVYFLTRGGVVILRYGLRKHSPHAGVIRILIGKGYVSGGRRQTPNSNNSDGTMWIYIESVPS